MPADPSRTTRTSAELRPVTLERGVSPYAEGSCLISFGSTRVMCTASVEEGVPRWRRGRGEGVYQPGRRETGGRGAIQRPNSQLTRG